MVLPREVDGAELHVVQTEGAILRHQLEEFQPKAEELQDKITELLEVLKQEATETVEDGVSYLAMKQQILQSYCLNLCIYMALKLRGRSVECHPVMQQLLQLQTLMEKLRPVDGKLRYQLDKLFRLAVTDGGETGPSDDPLSFRPNPGALMSKDGGDSDDDDEEDGGKKKGRSSKSRSAGTSEIYRPPRLASAPYEEGGKTAREAKEAERRRDRLRKSEILDTLRDEYGDKPEMVRATDGSMFNDKIRKKIADEDRERREFEEDHMIRLPKTKAMKKSRSRLEKAGSRLESIADVGNVGDFMRVSQESGHRSQAGSRGSSMSSALKSATGAVRVGGAHKKRRKA